MWCPPEYILLADIAMEISNKSWESAFEAHEPEDVNLFAYDDAHTPYGWRNDRAIALYLYSITRFIESSISDFFFIDQNGNAQRISRVALYSPRVFDGPFPEKLSEWRGIIDHLDDALIFVDEGDYSINSGKSVEDAKLFGLERVAVQLQEIDGRHLIWKIPVACSGMQDILEHVFRMVEFDVSKLARINAAQNKATPGETVWNTIWQAYPDGKGQATWQDVEKKTGYSRRSIRRALDKFGGHERWAGSGHSE